MAGFSSLFIDTKTIEDGAQLAEVIKALGGREIKSEVAALLLTPEVLAKIQGGEQLVKVIKALGGREIKAEYRVKLDGVKARFDGRPAAALAFGGPAGAGVGAGGFPEAGPG